VSDTSGMGSSGSLSDTASSNSSGWILVLCQVLSLLSLHDMCIFDRLKMLE